MTLNVFAFSAGFAIAGLTAGILLFAPMGLPIFGMHGYGMMHTGYGFGLALGLWAVVVSGIFGAIVAVVNNAIVTASSQPEAKAPH